MKIQCDFEQGYIDVWNETDEQWDRYVICNKKEEKKIPEKITINDNGTIGFPNGEWTARNMDKAFAMKINSIIDYLKGKGE